MMWIAAISALVLGLGWHLQAPKRSIIGAVGGLFLAVLAAHLILPTQHWLILRLGGTFAGWAVTFAAIAVIWAYSIGIGALRLRVQEVPMPENAPFSDTELDRYARHIVLREIGGPGQRALKDARVLVVGAGGLGAPALLYLAASGVGTIGVIDDDIVDNSNLQRQVIHRDADIGIPKVFSAEAAMLAQNPAIKVRPYHRRLDAECAPELFAEYDLILEGSDNFDTKYLVNRVAAKLGKPVIGGALSQWEGQISTWDPAQNAPCYQCVFPEPPAPGLAPNCAEAGVIGPLPGIIGAMMALEAIKELTGAGQGLRGRLMLYDALYGEARFMKAQARASCPICGDG